MTGPEYRKAIKTLGLNQQEAGRWLGLSRRTAQNYAHRGPPEAVGRLLALVVENVSFDDDAFEDWRVGRE